MPDRDSPKTYILPPSISQPVDVGRIILELGLIDEHLNQEALKNPEKEIVVKTSIKLGDFLKSNDGDLYDPKQRTALRSWLDDLRKDAPVVTLSFGAEANEQFIQKITAWFRKEVDKRCLIIIGLDPTIGIGSVVRTTNKVFDLSLKNRFKANHQLLYSEIQRVASGEAP